MALTATTEIHEQDGDFVATIGEMGGASIAADLPVPAPFMEQVRESDDDPMFVVVEVASGRSNNKRNWKPEHVRKVVDKVNKERMGGNLGHPLLDPAAYDSAFPIPQVVWVAAKAQEIGGKTVGRFKGYVLKTAEARQLLKLGLIDGVSWFGDMRAKRLPDGTMDVIDFNPETIDFARKGRSGMQSRVLALAGEQRRAEGGNGVEGRDVAALTPDDVRTHAPLLFKAIQEEATGPLNEKIGEQTAALATAQAEVDVLGEIKKLLNLQDGENVAEKLGALLENVEKAAKENVMDFVRSVVGKKLKTKRAQDVVIRLLGGEMQEWESEALTDEKKAEITAAVETAMKEDPAISALVGEMSGWDEQDEADDDTDDDDGDETTPPARQGGNRLGGRSKVGEMTGRKDPKKTPAGAGSVITETPNLKVTRRSFG